MSKNYIGACLAHNQFGDDEEKQPIIFASENGKWIGENASGSVLTLTDEEISKEYTVVDWMEFADFKSAFDRHPQYYYK